MALELWWWPMTSPWLSPGAVWFIFFNLLVGAIAIMPSRGQDAGGGHAPATRRRLARTASTLVMESLGSISIFTSHSGAAAAAADSCVVSLPQHVQDRYCAFQEREVQEASAVAPELREPERAPASGGSEATATPMSPSAPAAAAPVADVAPVSVSRSEKEDEDQSISLDQAYALARARRQSPAAAVVAADDIDTAARQPAKVAEVNRRAYAGGRGAEEVEGKAEVNARAERFIRQFREELKLERLNSILNYTDALRRRSGAVTGSARGNNGRLV